MNILLDVVWWLRVAVFVGCVIGSVVGFVLIYVEQGRILKAQDRLMKQIGLK